MYVEFTAVQKIAHVLKILVTVTLVINFLALLFVPMASMTGEENFLSQTGQYLNGLFHPEEDDIVAAGVAGIFIAWFWVWTSLRSALMCAFLLLCGTCTMLILRQGQRVMNAVLRGEPFSMENADSLRRAAYCSFIISAAALVRLMVGILHYHSFFPLISYNALFVPIFAMAGLLCLVMSALFRQAAEMKEESDLTI